MIRILTAVLGMVLAVGPLPASAAFSLDVPFVAAAPTTSTFPTGAVAKLDWNATDGRTADEPANVTLVSDGRYLYVRFDVTQTAPLIGLSGGDNVAIELWPNADSADLYRFGVGLSGARTDDSTANTAGWEATEATRPGGYSATMKIPMNALPSTNAVRVQLSRWIASTGELQVWAHSNGAGDIDQTGTLTVSGSVGAALTLPGGQR